LLAAGKVAETVSKIRNTLRFCLANVFDFKPEDALPVDQLLTADRYMLHKLQNVGSQMTEAYETFHFQKGFSLLTFLSSLVLALSC
jgi:isoleucyl-tRNA synthetase